MKATKKPVTVDFYTWEKVVKMGLEANPESIHGEGENARALNFMFHNVQLTHENDSCYIVPTLEGNHNFTPNDVLIIGVKGEVYPCKKDIFEMTYDINKQTYNFGQAIEALKQDKKVSRQGWNGKNMFLFYVERPSSYWGYEGLNWIGMKTADNKVVPWLASQTDMLAEDWIILD